MNCLANHAQAAFTAMQREIYPARVAVAVGPLVCEISALVPIAIRDGSYLRLVFGTCSPLRGWPSWPAVFATAIIPSVDCGSSSSTHGPAGIKTHVCPPPKAPSTALDSPRSSVLSTTTTSTSIHNHLKKAKKGESPASCIPRPHSDSPDIPLRHIDNEALLSPHPPQRPLSGRLPSLPRRGGGGGGDRHR